MRLCLLGRLTIRRVLPASSSGGCPCLLRLCGRLNGQAPWFSSSASNGSRFVVAFGPWGEGVLDNTVFIIGGFALHLCRLHGGFLDESVQRGIGAERGPL